MKATILITGENKEKYLYKTINSCLNQNYKNYEIILLFSNLSNIENLKKKFHKKVRFKKIFKKKNPVKDQLNKISEGIKIAKGKFIFLLDGDDFFKKDKIKKIIGKREKNKIYLDDHILLENNKFIYRCRNKLKNNFIYRYIINPWPDKVCTSCISGEKRLFEEFFKKLNINKYNYLAIDILIVIFYLNKIIRFDDILTVKNVLNVSVDKRFSNFYKKIYWERRIEQHKFLKEVQFKNYSLEFYFSKLISYFFDFQKYIQKTF